MRHRCACTSLHAAHHWHLSAQHQAGWVASAHHAILSHSTDHPATITVSRLWTDCAAQAQALRYVRRAVLLPSSPFLPRPTLSKAPIMEGRPVLIACLHDLMHV